MNKLSAATSHKFVRPMLLKKQLKLLAKQHTKSTAGTYRQTQRSPKLKKKWIKTSHWRSITTTPIEDRSLILLCAIEIMLLFPVTNKRLLSVADTTKPGSWYSLKVRPFTAVRSLKQQQIKQPIATLNLQFHIQVGISVCCCIGGHLNLPGTHWRLFILCLPTSMMGLR